jgi:flagellar hook-associated protein 2
MAMSLGGLASGMDTQAIVEQLVSLERQPIYRYEDEISQIEKKKGAWRDINSRISKLSDKLTDLKFSSTFNSKNAVSSNEDIVTATAGNNSAESTYDISVSNLAKVHRISSGQQTDSTSDLGYNGTININGTDINIESVDSLNDIRDTINNIDSLGAEASIIDDTLVLESTTTGTDSVLSISDTTGTVFQDLGVLDADGTTISNELQAAENAQLSINNIDIESQSNIIDQAVESMSFELKSLGTVNVEITKNTDKTKEAVQAFVDQYNSVMDFIDSKSNYNAEEDESAVLQGDGTLMRLQSKLRQGVMDRINTGGNLSHVSELGISIDRDGVMSLDSDKLTEALNDDSVAVAKFFNAESSEDGFDGLARRLDGYADQLIQTNTGVIPSRISSFNDRIKTLNESIEDVEDRVQMARDRYMQQFTAMETALSDMQQQQSWMSNQLSSLGNTNLSSML